MWLLPLLACNPAPDVPTEQVGYRDGLVDGEPNSGERGTVKISEILWSGSVDAGGDWDPEDVFVELRNEGSRNINVSGWQLRLEGGHAATWILPKTDLEIPVDGHVFIAAKDTGCFPEPDLVVPGLAFTYGDAFELTLLDADERLVEPVGNENSPPFAGGFDGRISRSMERIQLMFGGEGGFPHSWHFYAEGEVDVPNDVNIAENCREHTRASPGRANSPDYSGAFSVGSFE